MSDLFHGTTASRADTIEREGWIERPLHDHVISVSERFAVPPDAIWADLQARHRFVSGTSRGKVASFATSFEMGDSWAQRAPEIRTEALHAVWRLQHPDLADAPDAEIDGEVWVLRHQLEDPPAVVHVQVSDELLQTCRMGGFTSRELLDLDDLAKMWSILPEIEMPLPVSAELIVEVVEVPRRVRGAVALHLLGLEPDEWMRRAKAEEFGDPRRDRYGQMTWAWNDLAASVIPEQWDRRVPAW